MYDTYYTDLIGAIFKIAPKKSVYTDFFGAILKFAPKKSEILGLVQF